MICQKCSASLPATAPLPLCWSCTLGMAGRDELSQWLTDNPSQPAIAMLSAPSQPMEMASDGKTATAVLLAVGEVKGQRTPFGFQLYGPRDVVLASRTLHDGKPVYWDHLSMTDDRKVGDIQETWLSEEAVMGRFSVEKDSHRKVLRSFAETGHGGMSDRIQYLHNAGIMTKIVDVVSSDVVLSPATDTHILQASQTARPEDANWFAKARQFFSIPGLVPPLLTRKEPEAPQENDMTAEELAALMEAVKTTFAEEMKPHTAMLAEVQTQVSALALAQADSAAETTRKAAIRAKLAEDLPDASEEMLVKLVDLAYAQRGNGDEADAALAGVPAVVDAFKSIIAGMPKPEEKPEETTETTEEKPEDVPVVVPQPTTLSAMMSATPGATIPSGDEELAKFQAKFEASPEVDEHGRVKRPAPTNGAA